MTRIDKAISRLTAAPTPTDFQWRELEKVMRHFGFEKNNGNGSRVKFIHGANKDVINLHKPHPGSIVAPVYVQQVVERLKDLGHICESNGNKNEQP